MRVLVFLIFVITSSGCSSLMLGGGSAAGSAVEDDQAAATAMAADTATSNRVKGKFAADAELGRHAISVHTKAGMVTISGSVPSYKTRESAEKLAMATDGVKAVENKISVELSN
jgi:osmotically-inducible protein OsmY